MILLKLIRINDWLKSLFVLLGSVYGRYWYALVSEGLVAALAFNCVASSVYIINDLCDLKQDRLHPIKSKRPLAAGLISSRNAAVVMVLCLVAGLLIAYLISRSLLMILCAYFIINLFYNSFAKQLAYLDVLIIASGFMLRILAGTLGIGIPISHWLLLCGTLVSLLLALLKRKLELNYVANDATRVSLGQYGNKGLNWCLNLVSVLIITSYTMYCFVVDSGENSLGLLMTVPSCVFAFLRLRVLLQLPITNDNPVSFLLSDKWSLINMIVFVLLTLVTLT